LVAVAPRAATVAIAKRGVANVLRHAGILAGAVEATESRWLSMPSADCFTFADDEGIIETCVDLGQAVKAGEVVARTYPVGRTGSAPSEYRARLDGILAAHHFPGLVKIVDCMAVIATPER
jgi:N-alpha-acetyl-L-2,4-diaminobutyrate deacetylase